MGRSQGESAAITRIPNRTFSATRIRVIAALSPRLLETAIVGAVSGVGRVPTRYSNRSASTGLRLAAMIAGSTAPMMLATTAVAKM